MTTKNRNAWNDGSDIRGDAQAALDAMSQDFLNPSDHRAWVSQVTFDALVIRGVRFTGCATEEVVDKLSEVFRVYRG